MDAYYLSQDGGETGPFALADLAEMLRAGKISETSALRKDGSKDHFIAGAILQNVQSASGQYEAPMLTTLLRIIAAVWLVLGCVIAFFSGSSVIVALALAVFTTLLLFGMAQVIDLIGRIEFNTRSQ